MNEWEVPYEEEECDMLLYKCFIEEMGREPETQTELMAFLDLKASFVFG